MKTLKSTIIILILVKTTVYSKAQSHQIIIQLKKDAHIHQLYINDTKSPFTSYKQLSKHLNIWLIEMLHTTLKKEAALSTTQQDTHVKTAQLNEAVELKNTPYDLYFEDQWQYFNKAANQGITDADTDALKARNITTGGKTVAGNEIVVAVIDGGVDVNHPDLMNNLWTNANEMPENINFYCKKKS